MTRIRIRRAALGGANGLLIGAAAAGIAVALLRVGVYDEDIVPDVAFLVPPIIGIIAGILWGATRHLQPFAAARMIEQSLDLKERFSSALALASQTADAFSLRQRADAEAHAKDVDPTAVVPLTPIPRRAVAVFTAVLAAFLIWLLPTLPPFQSTKVRNDRALVKKEGERLVRIARTVDKTPGTKKLEETRKAASQLAKLGSQMQTGRLHRRKALIKVAKLTDQIKQAQQKLAAQSGDPNSLGANKSLPSAARDLQKALDAAQKSNAGQGLKTAAETGKDSSSHEGQKQANTAMQAAQKALLENNSPSLAEQLNKLADTVGRGEPKDTGGRQSLAAQLEALSEALKGTRLEKASEVLAEAANAMRSGDLQKAAEKLREAACKAAEAGAKSEDAQALSQMAQALQGSPDGSGMEQEISSEQMAQSAAGENFGDAFNSDGSRKGDKAGTGNGSGKLGSNGNGGGEGKEPGNGIGSGAGKVGGDRVVGKATAYTDPRTAPQGNKSLNRDMQKALVKTDKGFRLTVPKGNNTRVAGKRGEKGREMVTYTQGAPDKATASVPYYEVYGKYAPTAEKALSREDIPTTYKKQVKEYFEALRPTGKER
jgi:tetratricopeptide (TPR) repeat protein